VEGIGDVGKYIGLGRVTVVMQPYQRNGDCFHSVAAGHRPGSSARLANGIEGSPLSKQKSNRDTKVLIKERVTITKVSHGTPFQPRRRAAIAARATATATYPKCA